MTMYLVGSRRGTVSWCWWYNCDMINIIDVIQIIEKKSKNWEIMRQLSDNAVSGGQQTWNCEQVSSQVSFLRGRRSSPNTWDSWPSTRARLDQTNSDNWEIMRLSDYQEQARNSEQVTSCWWYNCDMIVTIQIIVIIEKFLWIVRDYETTVWQCIWWGADEKLWAVDLSSFIFARTPLFSQHLELMTIVIRTWLDQ